MVSGEVFSATLKVPATLTAGKATITVTFESSKSTSAPLYSGSAEVSVVAKSHSVFIQTDKPVYKPSQTG